MTGRSRRAKLEVMNPTKNVGLINLPSPSPSFRTGEAAEAPKRQTPQSRARRMSRSPTDYLAKVMGEIDEEVVAAATFG